MLWILLAICPAFAESTSAQAQFDVQYEIKAKMLYPLGRFVSSSKTAKNGRDTYVIGVLGDDPFYDADTGRNHLDEMVNAKKTLNGKRLQVRRFATTENMPECDMLFIAPSGEGTLLQRLSAALAQVQKQKSPVLIVADSQGLAKQGAVFSLYLKSPDPTGVQRVGIEFNPHAAKHHQFDQIEPQALRLFDIVR